MPNLWLTYCWDDNATGDVEYVAQVLERLDITVHLDRWDLTAGQRLWEQIGESICSAEICDSWAVYATQNSLNSDPCKEELYYALYRALTSRGSDFPLIGIFPSSVPSSVIPPAIRTRLYVSLTDPDWSERIRAAASGERISTGRPDIEPYELVIHQIDPSAHGPRAGLERKQFGIEMRPRAGVWCPFMVAFPANEQNDVVPELRRGPMGRVPDGCVMQGGRPQVSADGSICGLTALDEATPTQSFYLVCANMPSRIRFGVNAGPPQYDVDLR